MKLPPDVHNPPPDPMNLAIAWVLLGLMLIQLSLQVQGCL